MLLINLITIQPLKTELSIKLYKMKMTNNDNIRLKKASICEMTASSLALAFTYKKI